MKINFIYLSWRKGLGSRRKLVGSLKRNFTDGIIFKYNEEAVKAAQKEGFIEYPGFPIDFSKEYKEISLDIFSFRLIPSERTDIKNHLSFWEAEDYINDKFSLLAMTQGILPTDNFEFLGLYHPEKNKYNKRFRFVTDIAGLSYNKLDKDLIQTGDLLTYQFEYNKNAFKERAVRVFKGETFIGYIKNIHNNIFLESKHTMELTVKAVEKNDYIKQIFIKVVSKT